MGWIQCLLRDDHELKRKIMPGTAGVPRYWDRTVVVLLSSPFQRLRIVRISDNPPHQDLRTKGEAEFRFFPSFQPTTWTSARIWSPG